MATVETDTIPKTYEEAVALLAAWHGEGQDPPVTIYCFPDPKQSVVRLLEVSEDFPVTGKVTTWGFRPTDKFPFQSEVALVSPQEWAKINEDPPIMSLPRGWRRGGHKRVWPPPSGGRRG